MRKYFHKIQFVYLPDMRRLFIATSLIITGLILWWAYYWTPALIAFVAIAPLIYMGVEDMLQHKQTIRRNFPLVGRMRYLLEKIRPEIHQYFIESDTDGTPISRNDRSVIYQRAKEQIDTTPFGTQLDVYQEGYEWLTHSLHPIDAHRLDHHP